VSDVWAKLKEMAQRGVELATLQKVCAIALFILCTLPVFIILLWQLQGLSSRGLIHDIVFLLAKRETPTLYGVYVASTLSTLLGSVLLPSLKREIAGKTTILAPGIGVLLYSATVAAVGMLLLALVGDAQNSRFYSEMPDPGGLEKIKAYLSWSIGACLTVCATLVGVPAPRSQNASGGGQT